MGEIGTVVEVLGGDAVVSLVRTEACAQCRACAIGMRTEEMLMTAHNELGAAVGDEVRVELKDGAFLKAAWAMYGLPLVLLLGGFFIGAAMPLVGTPLLGIALGACGLVIGAAVIRRKDSKYKETFTPYVAEIINN